MRVERYDESQAKAWDEFVRQSKNGTFLFLRDYMDYHSDRFEDHSLLVWDEKSLVAMLPANSKDGVLSSHEGLTYGGFITAASMKLPKMLEVFEAALAFLQQHAFTRLIYKTVPHIYHRAPAEEDCYALFLGHARLIRRGVLTVIDSTHPLPAQDRRKRGARKAGQHGVVVRQSNDFETYWKILIERLSEAFDARPAHSLAEIQTLQARFPENIKLFSAFQGDSMLAGVVIYESELVAHVQYIAANERSRELGSVDLVFIDLLENHYRTKRYFDFGTSDEAEGRRLNKGLIDQKEGYGARTVAHDHYEMQVTDWTQGLMLQAI